MAQTREVLKEFNNQVLMSDQSITDPVDNDRIFQSPNDGKLYRDISSQTYKTSIAKIRAAQTLNPNIIYKTMDFGVPGEWQVDEADTTSLDNTGTILVTSGGQRLKRKLSQPGIYNLGMFGDPLLLGNDATDASVELQNLLDAAPDKSTIIIPHGVYRFTTPLVIPEKELIIKGEGKFTGGGFDATSNVSGITVLKWMGEDPLHTEAVGYHETIRNRLEFYDFQLVNGTSRNDIDGLILDTFVTGRMSGVSIQLFRNNLKINGDYFYAVFDKVISMWSKGDSIVTNGLANSTTFRNCLIANNIGRGFVGQNTGSALNFSGSWFDKNGGAGIDVTGLRLLNVKDCYFEGNGIETVSEKYQIKVGPAQNDLPVTVNIDGNTISFPSTLSGGSSVVGAFPRSTTTMIINFKSNSLINREGDNYLIWDGSVGVSRVSVVLNSNIYTKLTGGPATFTTSNIPLGDMSGFIAINDQFHVNATSARGRIRMTDALQLGRGTSPAWLTGSDIDPEGVVQSGHGGVNIQEGTDDIRDTIKIKTAAGFGNTGWVPFLPSNTIYPATGSVNDLESGTNAYISLTDGLLDIPTWATTDGAVLTVIGEDGAGRQIWIGRSGQVGIRGGVNIDPFSDDWVQIVTIGESEITGTVIDFRVNGARFKGTSADLILTTSNEIPGKPVEISITNEDAVNPHTVTITGVQFQNGEDNFVIPASSSTTFELIQIDGVIKGQVWEENLVTPPSVIPALDIDFSIDGSRFKDISADTTFTTSNVILGKKVTVEVTNTDGVNPHIINVTGAVFQDGSSNSIPAGGKAIMEMEQITSFVTIKLFTF